MDVTIVSASAEKIKKFLQSNMSGNKFTAYTNIDEFHEQVLSSALQTHILLIEDSGISRDPSSSIPQFNKLTEIIGYKFFSTERIVFINEESNVGYLERYKLLKVMAERKKVISSVKDKYIKVDIHVGKFKQSDYKNFITRDKITYDKVEVNNVVVIQKHRGVDISRNQLIVPEDIDPNEVRVSTFPANDGEKIKESFKFNEENFFEDIGEIEPQLNGEMVGTDFDIERETYSHDKYLMITGSDNSGVSTTALIMGRSAASLGKTLLIDCALNNMGLSHLVDKLFLEQHHPDVSEINLTDLYDKSIQDVIMETQKSANLHVMRIELPFIRMVGDSLEYVILNLLHQIEDKYQYVVFDLPFRVTKNFTELISKKMQRIVMTGLPYESKIVSNIMQLKSTGLMSTEPYTSGKFFMMLLNVVDRNGMPVVGREDFVDIYCSKLLHKKIPTTGFLKIRPGDDYVRTQYLLEILEKEPDQTEGATK